MDIKIIIPMLEDLKKLIIEQFSNLSKQIESITKVQPKQPSLPIIQQINLSELENTTARTNAFIKSEFQKSKEQLYELSQKLDEQRNMPPLQQKHLYTIELKSSMAVLTLISLGVLLLSSLIGNLYQVSENDRLIDNDIKYRYVKAMGEISTENLLKLETIFEYEPDKQKQRSLQKMVEDHEQRVEQRARELEQARLKEPQAEQLRQETERVKQKK